MTKIIKNKLSFLIVCTLLLLSITIRADAAAKYVFLFIGDGMGAMQRNAAEMYLAGLRDTKRDGTERTTQLIMNSLPTQAFIRTNSLDGVTDSAAAGTALATGQKTKNGTIAMDPTREKNLDSIAAIAKKNGMKVGIVTSAFLQDATPAAFYGHAPSRSQHYSIGGQLVESAFDYFGGGGFRNPTDKNKSRRSLLELAKERGYRIANTKAELLSLKPGAGAIAIAPKLRAGSMPFAIDRDPADIGLADFVSKGIELLEGERGFFMMIEGGNIDIACHANDAAAAIHETIAFDDALGVAMKFYKAHPGETLIVVTADHETGGMNVATPPGEYKKLYAVLSAQRGSYAAFERTVSPGSGTFDQLLANARKFFGDGLPAAETLRGGYRSSMIAPGKRPTKDSAYKRLYGPYDPFTMACVRETDARAGVSWTSFYHSGKAVPLSAIGAGAESFSGEYENAEVFHKLRRAMGM